MVEVLFKPFSISKWFGLGFCFFLANLGRGGGTNFNPGGGGGRGGPGGSGGSAPGGGSWMDWIQVHIYQIAGVVLLALLLITLLWAFLLWLRCRGVFMMIDGLALNRGLVKKPWHRYREAGNSLFGFNLILFLMVSGVMLVTLGVAGLIAWPDITNQTFGTSAIWAIIVLAVVGPLVIVNSAIIEMLLIDFIAPTMYIHGLRVRPAWKLWYREVFKGHFWILTLFYLMKMVLAIAAGAAAILATCMTCCITALPYIGTVILLPALVFMRCYTLYFLEQFGEPWRLFVYDMDRIPCISCGYDLRGNPDALTCPECGGPTPWASEANVQ